MGEYVNTPYKRKLRAITLCLVFNQPEHKHILKHFVSYKVLFFHFHFFLVKVRFLFACPSINYRDRQMSTVRSMHCLWLFLLSWSGEKNLGFVLEALPYGLVPQHLHQLSATPWTLMVWSLTPLSAVHSTMDTDGWVLDSYHQLSATPWTLSICTLR